MINRLTGILLLFSSVITGNPGHPVLSGEAWIHSGLVHHNQKEWHLRYTPRLTGIALKKDNGLLDYAVSLKFSRADTDISHRQSDSDIYRMWIRFQNDQSECRIGHQKIAFGSARLLRPLQWFDQINPADPTRFTDGVTGLKFRTTGMNNESLWFWLHHWKTEIQNESKESLNLGGRAEIPVILGEIGLTLNLEESDADNRIPIRFGMDGSWDVGPGIWTEIETRYQKNKGHDSDWETSGVLGMDYTFSIFSGLTGSLEFYQSGSQRFWAGMASCPIGFFSQLQIYDIYQVAEKQHGILAVWRQIYDHLILQFTAHLEIIQLNESAGGAGITLIYNH